MVVDWHSHLQVSSSSYLLDKLLSRPSYRTDFYPYFQFLKVPNFEFFESFWDRFCKVCIAGVNNLLRLVTRAFPPYLFYYHKSVSTN